MISNIDRHTFKGKRKIGSINMLDFIVSDENYIGSDPLYLRFNSVESVVKHNVPPRFAHFLAQPDYDPQKQEINWYIDDWKETPELLSEMSGEKKEYYTKIKDATLAAYRHAADSLTGEDRKVLKGALDNTADDKYIFGSDGKVFATGWGMQPDTLKHETGGTLIHDVPELQIFSVTFDAGESGKINGHNKIELKLKEGYILSQRDLPQPSPDKGYQFKEWSPAASGMKVDRDLTFTANYTAAAPPLPTSGPKPPAVPPVGTGGAKTSGDLSSGGPEYECRFDVGPYGALLGNPVIYKAAGDVIHPDEVPQVSANKGYSFQGWDINPNGMVVNGNTTFTAQYDQIAVVPWYKRWWAWLLAALLAALILFLILTFLRIPGCGCASCHREVNGVVPVATDSTNNFGNVKPINLKDGKLPDGISIVPPVRNEDGSLPPIIEQPGAPSYMQGRLILFLEDDNADIDGLAQAFKREFPGDGYNIIGFDREVKSLFVQIPENERDMIRETLPQRIPEFKFIVFDDEIYELNGWKSTESPENAGWHLQAVNAQAGWQITEGSKDVVVAVVDDGIDASHEIFNGRIVNAYNVFTQNNHLSVGQGHGTHVAALAVGSKQNLDKGVAGIAPQCSLMPVQVSDDGLVPLSAVISGIMYAVHKDADVINVSIGPDFRGLDILPVSEQENIAATRFKNMEKLWNRICNIASRKNTVIVFAAGNNDIISAIPPENRNGVSITVGAVDRNLCPTEFTNFGPRTDISAPGQGILSAMPGNNFEAADGTSMSAPIVAGTIALMKTLKKDLTVEQALNVLYNTGKDVYGYMPPMVQVNLALEAVKRGDFSPAQPRVLRPVPEDEVARGPGGNGDTPPSSWVEPLPDQPVVLPAIPAVEYPGVVYPGDDSPGTVSPGTVNSGTVIIDGGEVVANPTQGDDYDAIRKQIERYKKRIAELEQKLPENQRK